MKERIYRNIEGKKVLLLFIVTNIVYGFMLLVSIPKVMSYSGGMKLFDMMPMGYGPEYAFPLLEKLGEVGRHAYLFYQIPLDMIYPGLFGITYCLLLAYLLNRLNTLKEETFYLCIIPLLAGMFDYFENFGIIDMLVSYPQVSGGKIQTATFFTVIKSLFSTVTFTLLGVGMLVLGYRKLFSRK